MPLDLVALSWLRSQVLRPGPGPGMEGPPKKAIKAVGNLSNTTKLKDSVG